MTSRHTPSCRTPRDLSSSYDRPVYPCFSDFCSDRILYREGQGMPPRTTQSPPFFAPAETFSTAKLLAWILTSADFRRYKFPLETHVPLMFWLSFVRSSLYPNSRLFRRNKTVVTIMFEIFTMHIEVHLFWIRSSCNYVIHICTYNV